MSKFIVSSSALLKALTPLSAVIASNVVVPILENFLFVVESGKLTLTASNLEQTLSTSLPVESREPAMVCVPAKVLTGLLKQLPDQPVTITIDTDTYRVELRSANGRYQLAGEDAADYPKTPELGPHAALELPSSSLLRAIGKTNFAISTDELRPAMTGVLVQLQPSQLTFVATDGHRLLRYRRLDVGASPGLGARSQFIIPARTWTLLKSVLPAGEAVPVLAQFGEGRAAFTIGQLHLATRLIDERYPDYENVIPVSSPHTLLIHRQEWLNALKRIALLANRQTHQVRLRLAAAELELVAEDLDFSNEGREVLACQYDGEPMEIGFNAKFLIEMLSNLDNEEVALRLTTSNRAGLLEPAMQVDGVENVLMLAMPVMLHNYV